DPGAVVAGGDLAQLVGADLGQRAVVGRGGVVDRNLRRHPAHRVRTAAVAGVDQQLGIGAQERLVHADLAALGQDPVGGRTEGLDVAEDVVPPAAVETRNPGPQRVQDL